MEKYGRKNSAMKILPFIRRFCPRKNSLVNSVLSSETVEKQIVTTAANTAKTTPVPVTQAVKQSLCATESVANSNPFLETLYRMYEQDGVSRSFVDKYILGGAKQRFYRYVGEEELALLLRGEKITSSRPCHKGALTDITTNPDYGKIPTIGKYRLTFKDKNEFAPFDRNTKSRVIDHDIKDCEYYIVGGYDLSDVEKVEKKLGNDTFIDIDFL